jgi:hypothetical protein
LNLKNIRVEDVRGIRLKWKTHFGSEPSGF